MDSPPSSSPLPPDYPRFLAALKERIRTAQIKAALSVNRELIALYWHIGGGILDRQRREGWGTATVRRLSQDLSLAFPTIAGFSPRNIWRMRAFHIAWAPEESVARPVRQFEDDLEKHAESEFLPQAVAELPWGHNAVLIEYLRHRKERLWYAKKTLEHHWSRSVLIRQIETGLYRRQGNAQTNFALTLPKPQAKKAQEALKDEYALDFLAAGVRQEKSLEQGIIENTQKFLMELGKGFAFMGRQVRLTANEQEHIVDLMLYNVILHSYVVVELKAGPFKPEHVSKLSSYLTAADACLRRRGDQESIGVILCRSKNRIVVEYALRDQRRPIGVACYRLTKALPDKLTPALPSTRELEDRLNGRPG